MVTAHPELVEDGQGGEGAEGLAHPEPTVGAGPVVPAVSLALGQHRIDISARFVGQGSSSPQETLRP